MNRLNLSCYLIILLISCHSLLAAAEEEDVATAEQTLDTRESPVISKGRSNDATTNFMRQFFGQSLIPSLSYDRSQSISHNLGYNLGRTVGRTPFMGASLDPQAAASKVVLVLANDTPETAALPQPDPTTLKRLVRNPEFLDEFVSQIALIKDQISQQVPAISRTMGVGFNEVLSQAPILSQAQQAGAIDYAKLGQTFGESLLPERMFAGVGDVFNFTAPQDGENQAAPPPETERVENELAPEAEAPAAAAEAESMSAPSQPQAADPQSLTAPFDAMLRDNPLFRNFQPFLPPTLPPAAENNPFAFNPAQPWSWLPANPAAPEAAASDISEVRVKPQMESPYKIAPKEGATQRMTEMKLRAAMKDALNKKTIPILWFHLTDKDGQESCKTTDKTTFKTDEDMKMRMKLEAFEKQLILELQQLQEVVKLANAMKKAHLEVKGKKSGTTESTTPLALSTTPIYKITLDDIEKTLKDEYVQKLLQMISNKQKTTELPKTKTMTGNTKYATELSGNPNKRQTSPVGTTTSNLSKEDMLNLMAYAYRMAAAKGQEMPWLKEDNMQTLDDQAKSTQFTNGQRQRMERPEEKTNEQQWLMDKQQQMAMEAEKERAEAEERKHKHGGHHHHHPHTIHHHHFGRQFPDEPQMQMRQGAWLSNNNQPMMTMPPQDQQMRQGSWLTNDGQPMMTMPPQEQQMRQGGWLKDEDKKMPAITQDPQMRQGGWLKDEEKKMPTMAQEQQMRQGGWLNEENKKMPIMPQEQQMLMKTMQQDQQMRQAAWLMDENKKMAQDQQMRQNGGWLTEEVPKMMTMQKNQQTGGQQRQWFEPSTEMKPQTFETTQAQMPRFMANNGDTQQQMRQMNMPATFNANPNTNSNMQMRQQEWGITSEKQTDTTQGQQPLAADMQQQRQMMPQQITQTANEMRKSTNEQQMTHNPPMEMNEQQRQMTNTAEQPHPTPMERQGDAKQDERKTEQQPMLKTDERQMATHDTGMPIAAEATPQMPENAGKARFKELEDLFDEFDLFGHHDKKHKDKKGEKGSVVNYYYGPGGATYQPPPVYAVYGGYGMGYGGGYAPPPPPPPPSYGYGAGGYGGGYGSYGAGGGGGYAKPSYGGGGSYGARPQYKPSTNYGGRRPSNAYGGSGYRTAVGDEEIEEMLKEHQTGPEMMLTTRTDDATPTKTQGTPTPTTIIIPPTLDASYLDNADLKTNQTKRLANGDFAKYNSFLVVVRPETKSLRRSRRSATEYATLEPIDESSLSELRKTYKNSLKEITLNPNETPAEALKRYNEESVREALAKANKEPMEVTAGDEETDTEAETTAEHSAQQHYGMAGGYLNVANPQLESHNHLNSIQYSHSHSQSNSPSSLNDFSQYQQYVPQMGALFQGGEQFNALSPPYGQYQLQSHMNEVPLLYAKPSTKNLPQSPYLAVVNTFEPMQFMDDYSGVHATPYQLGNDNAIFKATKTYANKDSTYTTQAHPMVVRLTNSIPNSLGKLHQDSLYASNNYANEFTTLKTPPTSQYTSNSLYHSPQNSYNMLHSKPKVVKQYERLDRFDHGFESLIETMKQRLSECCNECKEKLLRGLEEALRQPSLGHAPKQPKAIKWSTITNAFNKSPKANDEENDDDDKFQVWLQEMSGRGYDKHYLTRDHQKEYLKNGRYQLTLNKHDPTEELLYGQNQSFKRDTTIAETETDADRSNDNDTELKVELNENKLVKGEEKQSEDTPEVEEFPQESEDNIKDEPENSDDSLSQKTSVKSHPLETAESTTHSIYALRGKYKPSKRNVVPVPYNSIQGKKFANQRSIKKLGSSLRTGSKSKSLSQDINKIISRENAIEKHKHLEEILDLLHELNKANKEKKSKVSTDSPKSAESSTTVKSTTESSPTSTTSGMTSERSTTPSVMKSSQRFKLSTSYSTVTPLLTSSKPKMKRRKLKLSPKPTRTAISRDYEISEGNEK